MTGKIEYLEKYSVAPSPSRDYYGLKVLRDQVILYLWRISHGPHRTPIVRTSTFDDFTHDKFLQNEIQRVFGEYLLKHVRNITVGRRNTLLTLPKCLIEKLVRYLTVNDIVKLSTLSHVAKEIFNNDFVWESLYKNYKSLRGSKHEKFYVNARNWKQLFQQAQMQGLMNEQKVTRARLASKQTKTNPRLEDSTKPSSAISKGLSKATASANQAPKKPSESIRRKAIQNSVSRKLSDARLDRSTIENEKIALEKKIPVVKSLQTMGQRNAKSVKEQLRMATRNESKREAESKDFLFDGSLETKPSKAQGKARRTDAKNSNTSIRVAEEKFSSAKLKNSAPQKAVERQRGEKLGALPTQEQTRPKTKGRTRKIGQSKSTILGTSSALTAEHSAIRDDSFDLADLIEASLKNIRSPRSIFDYNFSCIEKPEACAGDSKLEEEYRKIMDSQRGLKSGRVRVPLDRLSEKSEPLTAKSLDSYARSDVSAESATPKFTKTPKTKAKLIAEANKNRFKVPVPEDKADTFERYGIYNKYPTPRTNDNIEQKRSSLQKTVDRMDLLRSLGSNTSCGKILTSGRAADTNRYQLRKAIGSFYKH